MTMHPLKIVLAAVAFLALDIDAFSTGVGSCGAGETSIRNADFTNPHNLGTGGTLADLGVTFSIGGTALTAGTATTFGVGSDLQWSIDSTNPFKGALIRVEKAAGTFTHVAGSDLLNEALLCAGLTGVQGLDHSTAAAKTSVTGTSTFDAAGQATVDIVVVFTTSSYAYAQFLLTLDQVAVPTETPVAAPVAAPTETPVAAPVAAPTETPVAAPVAAPTETPVAAPVAAPTETPVAAPVAAPTEAPVAAPVPVIVPTAAPVAAPIVPVFVPTAAPVAAPIAEPVAPPTKVPEVTIEPTTTPPLIVPTKPPKKMGMEMKGKKGKEGKVGKEGKEGKVGNEVKEGKEGKKDMKGMKRHNLRY